MRPVPIPDQPAELTIDGKPFPAPITVSPLVQAIRYGFVWCPTDDLERCVVPDPAAALGDARARRGATTSWSTRSATGTRSCRPETRTRGSRARAARPAYRWPRPILWIAVALVALAVRRPRGTAPMLVLGGVAALVLLVHALSQAPQSEFAAAVRAASGSPPRSWRCSRRRAWRPSRSGPTITAVPRLELIPPGEFARVAAADVDADARLALLADMCRVQRAHRGQAGRLRAPRLDLQLARPRRPPPVGGAERRERSASTRPIGTCSSPRRATTCPGLYAALNALGVDPDGAAPAAAAARRPRRPPGRRRARDRGELGLARDGDLEGARDRLGEAPPRPRRPGGRDDG